MLAGEFADGATIMARAPRSASPACSRCQGQDAKKRGAAKAGDTVAFGRLEQVRTGETLTTEKGGIIQIEPSRAAAAGVRLAIELKDRKDEVKLSAALAKLMEEDPSLRLEHAKDTHQVVL